ncbi:MAG: hypothetical protein ABSB97_09155, partial [Thermoplasmata archaeon]
VSSRRIRNGEIDPKGHRVAPIRVGVGADDPADRDPVGRAVHATFPSARLAFLRPVLTGPVGRPTAQARAQARDAVRGRDLGLGVVRRANGGWCLVERSPTVELSPRDVAPGSSASLRRAALALLRPSRT